MPRFGWTFRIGDKVLQTVNNYQKDVFNGDAAMYGGGNVSNAGASLPSSGGRLRAIIPANGCVVLVRQ